MSETIEQTWEQEMLERGIVRGQTQEARYLLWLYLEKSFGPLPPKVEQQIKAIDDLERLRGLFGQALRATSLSELDL